MNSMESAICAAPIVVTPGSVQPGMGMTRSIAPVQRMAASNATSCWRPRDNVLSRFALRNSLIVVVTIIGLQLGGLVSGAVVTERIFGLPGFGKLTLDSVFTRDYPVIQAVVIITTFAYIVINLAIDLLYSLINPRIRVGGSTR